MNSESTDPPFPFKTAFEWIAFGFMLVHLAGATMIFYWLSLKIYHKRNSTFLKLLFVCSILGLAIVSSDIYERLAYQPTIQPYSRAVKNIQSWSLAIAILLWIFALIEIIKLFGAGLSKSRRRLVRFLIVLFHFAFALPMYIIYFFDAASVSNTWLEQVTRFKTVVDVYSRMVRRKHHHYVYGIPILSQALAAFKYRKSKRKQSTISTMCLRNQDDDDIWIPYTSVTVDLL
jgi:hypothetical protein